MAPQTNGAPVATPDNPKPHGAPVETCHLPPACAHARSPPQATQAELASIGRLQAVAPSQARSKPLENRHGWLPRARAPSAAAVARNRRRSTGSAPVSAGSR